MSEEERGAEDRYLDALLAGAVEPLQDVDGEDFLVLDCSRSTCA
jgi:hypothetical protein